MTPRAILRAAAILGAIAVAAGAFGAHALKARLDPADLEIWNTAVRYQAWHALALLGGAALAERLRLGFVALAWIVGTVVFSGSLFVLVISGARWLGAVTPIGGTLLILGWVMLAFVRTAPTDPA